MRSPSLLLLLLALVGTGCSYAAVDVAGGANQDVDPVRGQTIVFVGTDPITLRTNIYRVQAISQDDFATDEERNAAVLFAEGFELTVLTDFEVGPEGPLVDDGDIILPSEAPFAVPDRLGNRVGVVIGGYDFANELPVGRAAVVDLATGDTTVAPDVPGLTGVRFSWLGQFLVLEHRDPLTGLAGVSTIDLLTEPLVAQPVDVPGSASVAVAGLERESDAMFLSSSDAYGVSRIVRFEPLTSALSDIAPSIEGAIADVHVNRTGDRIAASWVDPDTARRTVVVADTTISGGSWVELTSALDADCSQPAWNPARTGDEAQQLAYVCEDSETGRPDVLLWEGSSLPSGAQPPSMETLTGGAQPAVPEGS
ncbi:MAG: hypothetical protein KDA24_17810, partial [Deltaproteobacteria bacterium]|nr:hypothetical protein [Deltaproteobacteria bacterium]